MSTSPMLPPSAFTSRTFVGANVLTLLLYAALGGALFFLPFNLVRVQHYSPTGAGGALLPLTLLLFSLSRWAGGLVPRYGARRPLIVGPLIAAVGFALFAVPGRGGSYWQTFFPAVVVLGVGLAISVAPLTTTVMGALGPRESGVASGINNAVARTAGLLAIAAMGALASRAFTHALSSRLSELPVSDRVRSALAAQPVRMASPKLPPDIDASSAAVVAQAAADAFVATFRILMLIAATLAFLAALTAALTMRERVGTSRGG